MSVSSAARSLAIVGLAVAAVLVAATSSAATTTDEPSSTTSSVVESSVPPRQVDWFLRATDGCDPGGERVRPTTISKTDAICVAGLAADPELVGLLRGVDDSGFATLTVAPFDWDDDNVTSGATVGFSTLDGTEDLRVTPNVRLLVEYRHSPGPEEGAAASSDAPVVTTQDPAPLDPDGGAGGDSAPSVITVDAAGLDKVVTVTGDDLSGVSGLAIRERVDDRLVVTGPDGVIEADEGQVLLELERGGRSASFDIAVSPTLNSGVASFTATTELLAGDTRITAAEQPELELLAPAIAISPSLSGSAETGSRSLVVVEVRNGATAIAARPLMVRAVPTSGSGAIDSISGVSDGGMVVDDAVEWTLPGGLEPGDTALLTFLTAFGEGSTNTEVTWRVTVSRSDSVLVQDESLVVPVSAGRTSTNPIDFAPGQLIRLLAFVVAFAIMAVIYGAWSRGRAKGGRDGLRVFEIFAQSIIVIVILVAVLVLALQGGLSGESAASLIGVIAGYVLRQASSSGSPGTAGRA